MLASIPVSDEPLTAESLKQALETLRQAIREAPAQPETIRLAHHGDLAYFSRLIVPSHHAIITNITVE